MAVDFAPALTWLHMLYPQLKARQGDLGMYDSYYSGDHPLPFLTPAHADKMRSQFRQMLEESRSNFMRLLVDVVDERLEVEGFRLSADSDIQTDKDSWDIWQANKMDSLSRAAILDSLVKGVSYISVWGDTDGDGYADIAVEDAREVIVAYTPGSNFRSRDAALKLWCDDGAGLERATVFMPDGTYRFQRKLVRLDADDAFKSWSELSAGTQGQDSSKDEKNPWVPLKSAEPFAPNSTGIVPMISLRNRGRTLVEGESELADVYPIQNQINGFIFLLCLSGYFGAHRQRWASGLKLTVDEASGQFKEPYDSAVDKVWVNENPDGKFGDFSETSLDGYIKAIEQKVAHLAVVSRTPKHYLLPEGQEPSGDAIKSAESGLVRKVGRKQTSLGESLEEVMQLARMFQGEDGAEDVVDSETVWADASTESEAVRADATIKKYAAGLIPHEQALEDLGYTQTQITRMMAMIAAEKLLNQVAMPDPTTGKIKLNPADLAVEPGDSTVTPPGVKA